MQDSQHTRPLVYGFIAAGLVPVVLFMGYAQVVSIATHNDNFIVLIIGIFGLVVSIPCAFLLGAPYVLLLRQLGWLYAAPVCLGASAAGAMGLWAMSYNLNYFSSAGKQAHAMAMGAAAGALLPGAIFGLVAGLSLCIASGVRWRAKRT